MSNDQQNDRPRTPSLLSMRSATTLIRSVFARERQLVCENQFEEFIKVLEQREYQSLKEAQEAVEKLYLEWASKYELIKAEFNDACDLFQSIESRVPGWYCVSPNLARWKSVNVGKFGYNFATCIMKNHHRDAPMSEKSLSVTFGLDETPGGIGDERLLGLAGDVDDNLRGLEACTPKSLREQGDGAKSLYRRLENKQIIFRLNHRSIGQQTTRLPISVLSEYSLRELCQGLFLMLNNDIISELKTVMSSPQKLLASSAEDRDMKDIIVVS